MDDIDGLAVNAGARIEAAGDLAALDALRVEYLGRNGVLTEQLGYAGYFVLTAGFALPAFALIPAARRWLDE